MAKNVRNFDAMISEMNHETIAFQIFGKTYEIEKRMPALIPLELARYDDDAAIPLRVLFRAARSIFGEDTLNELCKHPEFSADVLSKLIAWAFDAINGIDADEPEAVTEDTVGAPERKN